MTRAAARHPGLNGSNRKPIEPVSQSFAAQQQRRFAMECFLPRRSFLEVVR
jgi:hypothetical protein